jgi:hypothetical protein
MKVSCHFQAQTSQPLGSVCRRFKKYRRQLLWASVRSFSISLSPLISSTGNVLVAMFSGAVTRKLEHIMQISSVHKMQRAKH